MINLIAPINTLGYGVAGYNILKELYKIDNSVSLYPISQPQDFEGEELRAAILNQQKCLVNRPCVKIWHQNDLTTRVGNGKYIGFPIFELTRFSAKEVTSLHHCDKIFVCSKWAKDIVQLNTKFKDDDVHVVPLGVDNDIFSPSDVSGTGTQFAILNCGKWEVRKGHDVLFRAFKMAFPDDVRDVKLFMMCDNPFPQAKQQSEQFQNMYASDIRVKLIPRVNTSEEVAQIMGQVDCGVFPARGEGWNLELLEMMSMGKPVIATNYAGHTQFCDALNCALVDIEKTEPAFDGVWFDGKVGEWASIGQNQVKQLADHMRRAYELWKQEPVTTHAGIETAKKFTWKNSAEKLLGAL